LETILKRSGQLLEQSHVKAEIGAAITTTPNGVAVLKHWGIDPKELAVKSQAYTYVRGDNFGQIEQERFDAVEDRYGHSLYHWHRVDLHQTLRDHAASRDLQLSPPAHLSLGQRIVDVDCDQGAILFEDGKQVRKDLLVIADGHKVRWSQTVPVVRKLI
jgi:salicylate hydroxylase